MRNTFTLLIWLVLLSGCRNRNESKLFRIHEGPKLGIDFRNTITTNDTLNALSFEYIYNGSGIGIGDFNNDGLEDVFFGGNQVSCELYLNRGNLQFEKVTLQSGLKTDRWVTGVSVVDINNDGLLDIYLSVGGMVNVESRKNLLFVNQGITDGIPMFKEMAKNYGLDDDSYSTMAAFFDYDKDGDLDMYLLNNWLEKFNRNNLRAKRMNGEAESTDKLFRNNGDNTFTDVSRESGILIEGYGLGINICDINNDSWPDIYVANDFMSNDLLWVNQGDGTFVNRIGDFLKHQTHNGMGVDIADFNNDALPDIVVVDMLPPGHARQKMMTPGQNYDHFHMSEDMGYQPQYMRNTLQLNRGKFEGDRMLFSEIAFMSAVSRTDWSWAPLFADFDNDGKKDLFIANGYRKDVTDLDFIFFGLKADTHYGSNGPDKEKIIKDLNNLPEVKLSNYVFQNTGSLKFIDKTKDWGVDLLTFSNGAVYADLDNDGDLDLITNNIDQEVIFYENVLNERINTKHHYIKLRAEGAYQLNYKCWLFVDTTMLFQEFTPYRGYQSSVSQHLHFGLGEYNEIDSLIIQWQDNTMAVYKNLKSDTLFTFHKQESKKGTFNKPKADTSPVHFKNVHILDYTHEEKSPSDIKSIRTLTHELTRYGPCVAVGDVDNDGLDDFFIGGEKGQHSILYVQQADGRFRSSHITSDSTREDGDALFFDSDGDGDLDLYVGGACHSSMENPSAHQLYLNDGKGNFTLSENLPEINTSTGVVVAADYDGDGDLDLFIGGKLNAKSYPLPARSYILQNENGIFRDVTTDLHADLEFPGLVSSAVWVDINRDNRPDLIIAGEWMPIRIFINEGNHFTEQTKSFGLEHTNGWWNCLKAADLNNDGYIDLIGGNTGTNSFFEPTVEEPVRIVAKDFDNNGSMDPLVTYYNPVEDDRFIIHNRLVLIDQIPGFKRRFVTFSLYANTPFGESFRKDELEDAYVAEAKTLHSMVLKNDNGKKFEMVSLPEIAQISSINDVLIDDLNLDGYADLITIGNNHAQETLFGRYNATIGTVFLGNGKFNWSALDNQSANLLIEKQAQSINLIKTSNRKMILILNNNGPAQTIEIVLPVQ